VGQLDVSDLLADRHLRGPEFCEALTDVLDVLGDVGARTVGFAAHVDEELMAAASAAGCDEVLARSVFFRRFPDFVS